MKQGMRLSRGSENAITTGMILAAGFGKRMRPLTLERPKPLVPLLDRALIDWCLDRIKAHGIEDLVINTHYLGHMIEDHFKGDPRIRFSPEEEILETGGGVLNALPLLGEKPLLVCNSDTVWLEGPIPALARLEAFWDPKKMDALLLMQPTFRAFGYQGFGDYHMDGQGSLSRRRETEVAPFLFAGVQILKPGLLEGEQPGAFSLNRIYDKAEKAGRLFGLVHDGEWYHLGTPDALEDATDIIRHGLTTSNTR
ncbi:nucleotidyltransferase family protein [Aestuariispira insulae]|uniref:MurNAc alpha-1-phosphate uridylyltransferase n=1 Tax=Aestuariispira insulae TaxID=1461337 RepID=A0A3D9HPG8_9PROT|nr:nucleotidyltransferase family protein [Aestuariispira insulae]RED51404.1 MurNAc alpha-1-phosphate uridylyltransferase [Aestuariispira insulae]